MSSQAPICEVCRKPMQFVEALTAEKEGEKITVEVYACLEHGTFSKRTKTRGSC